jgi:hypothetical protein
VPYTRTTWQDYPNTTTPITAASLNNVEAFLESISTVPDAWTSYTPTLTNLTLGTAGTVTGRAMQAGKFVFVDIVAILGTSGFSVGSNPEFSIPSGLSFGSSYTNNISSVGTALAVDQVANVRYQGYTRVQTSTTVSMGLMSVSGSSVVTAGVTSTAPFTWAAGDELRFHFWFEAS